MVNFKYFAEHLLVVVRAEVLLDLVVGSILLPVIAQVLVHIVIDRLTEFFDEVCSRDLYSLAFCADIPVDLRSRSVGVVSA